jgi:thiamine pyrophosphate-dependent acetolactate synthase large subunit-like protein
MDLPVVCVIGNNAGWTSAQPERERPGVYLGHTRYEEMFAPLGAHTEFVDKPGEIRPALERALSAGRTAVVNVLTDPMAKSETPASPRTPRHSTARLDLERAPVPRVAVHGPSIPWQDRTPGQ